MLVLFVLVVMTVVAVMMLACLAHVMVDVSAITAKLPLVPVDVAPLGLGCTGISVLDVLA
jgi:hypothetical protein